MWACPILAATKNNNMLKYFCFIALLSCNTPASKTQQNTNVITPAMQQTSVHNFKVKSLTGEEINFASFKGKKILIVNTASECGYTPQYAELEKLYQQYQNKLVIVGFPANDFGGQEPGSNTEIKSFCQKNYGVTFPMAEKITVKGNDIAPVYNWLTHKELNGVLDAEIKWNFNKFLLDEEGRLIKKFDSGVNPLSDDIVKLL